MRHKNLIAVLGLFWAVPSQATLLQLDIAGSVFSAAHPSDVSPLEISVRFHTSASSATPLAPPTLGYCDFGGSNVLADYNATGYVTRSTIKLGGTTFDNPITGIELFGYQVFPCSSQEATETFESHVALNGITNLGALNYHLSDYLQIFDGMIAESELSASHDQLAHIMGRTSVFGGAGNFLELGSSMYFGDSSFSIREVPEPGTLACLVLGLMGVYSASAIRSRRRRTNA